MPELSYFNGHNHTHYSNIRMLDCIVKENKLIDYAIELGLDGVAITDHEALGGHVKALKYIKSLKAKARKILESGEGDLDWAHKVNKFVLGLGNEIYLVRDGQNAENYDSSVDGYWHFILIAKDEIGHKQLRELSSCAWKRSYRRFIERVPTYYSDIEEIVGSNPGHLIATTRCLGGYLPKLLATGEDRKALNFCNWCESIFGDDFYIEIQPSETEEQIQYNSLVQKFAAKNRFKVIVATDTHYLKKEDRSIHKAFLNSNEGDREVDSFYASTYLMDIEELYSYFPYFSKEYFLSVVAATKEIAGKIKEYDLYRPQAIPRIPLEWDKGIELNLSDNFKADQYDWIHKFKMSQYMADRIYVDKILKGLRDKEIFDKAHLERVDIELEQIWKISEQQNDRLSNYFLTMQKIIDLMWEAGSIIGVGRGSVFTHLCSYCLDIIQSDPLTSPLELPYWRFLSEERPEYPKHHIGVVKIGERAQRCA